MDNDRNKELFTEEEMQRIAQEVQAQQRPQPQHRAESLSFGRRIYNFFAAIVPKWGDRPIEWIRKTVSLLAASVMIAAIAYLLNEMVIIPTQYDQLSEYLSSIYQPGVVQPLTPDEEQFKYPNGITDDFKKLYYLNNDVRGWLEFKSTEPTDSEPFINISYPVMYAGNNDYYLNHDFQKAPNRNGSLFLDYRNNITSSRRQKSVIIYGHNLSNDQMFTRLNYLVRHSDQLYYARYSSKFTFNTLYEQDEYLVFAVMVTNTRAEDGPVFGYLRTNFSSDDDFMSFVAEIRARSLYDYNGVTVEPDDELLVLSTCNSKSYAGVDEGRTVVVARKVRDGEDTNINKYSIVQNEDVIMPYAWYIYKGLEPHPYYIEGGFDLPEITTTTTTTTTTTDPNGTDTTTDPTGTDTTTDPGSTDPTSTSGSVSEQTTTTQTAATTTVQTTTTTTDQTTEATTTVTTTVPTTTTTTAESPPPEE